MGLEDRLDNDIGTLSGGQRQALTLLMASWLKPDLLLLDEHTAALDPKSADQVIRLTHEIIKRDKLTTLMVTHSMQQAVRLGDRLIMMHRGSILHDIQGAEKARARPEDLLQRFETTAVFQLESRGMKDLIKRLQPDCFEDMIALVALFRPGPLQSGMVDNFIERKHGKEAYYGQA
jgi:putative ABC transport system ATP-binding protein